MKCHRCGKPRNREDRFCQFCRTPLLIEPSRIGNPNVGYVLRGVGESGNNSCVSYLIIVVLIGGGFYWCALSILLILD